MTILSEGTVCKVCNISGREVNINRRCKECDKAFFAEYRRKNKERLSKYIHEWQVKNKQHLSEYNTRRRNERLASMSMEQQAEFRREECSKALYYQRKLKNEVFLAYGGYVCNCCGETEPSFLTIDHINNDGNRHRRELGRKRGVSGSGLSSSTTYRWIRKNGFPVGFQVLCMNCQFGKRMNNGICPHTVQRATVIPGREVGSSDPKRRESITTLGAEN